MKATLGDTLLPERPLRWLGVGLLAAAVAVPAGVVVWRAASWQPLPAEADQAGEPLTLRPELVVVLGRRPVTFTIGSNEPGSGDDETPHEVTLSEPFALARTEVTQGQYFAVTGKRPVESEKPTAECASAGLGDDLPVVCVSWLEAAEYCNELSVKEGLEKAYEIRGDEVTWTPGSFGYRLPTESEWEYAARAGTTHRFVGTGTEADVCLYGNVMDASLARKLDTILFQPFDCDDGFATLLSPVGSHLPNRWLLHGLGGNAAEWVWDGYEPFSGGAVTDPRGAKGASNRVIRGGSWGDGPLNARVANRAGFQPSTRIDDLGFRIARSLPSAILPPDPLPTE